MDSKRRQKQQDDLDARQRVLDKELALKQAYQAVFDLNNHDAQLVMDDLAKYCGVARQSFVPDNQYVTAFNEGQRNVFLYINEQKDIDVTKYTEDKTYRRKSKR